MRLASLILPTLDNDGRDTTDAHLGLRAVLIDTFGGFTATCVDGGWRDAATGKTHLDSSVRYEIAMEISDANRATLESIARFYGHMARQICVLVCHADGDVTFPDCATRELVDA
jgi:hypothetical protein